MQLRWALLIFLMFGCHERSTEETTERAKKFADALGTVTYIDCNKENAGGCDGGDWYVCSAVYDDQSTRSFICSETDDEGCRLKGP
jgi:alpha-D-ribose 1-methylphosphonate 5-phosphate C-P lyase